MKKNSQGNPLAVAAVVLAVCYVLGGCCVFFGADLKNDGKSVYVPQVVVGVGFFVVPTLLIAGIYTAHALGFRPGPTSLDKLQQRIRSQGRAISPLQGGDDAVLPASWAPVSQLGRALQYLGEKEATFKHTAKGQAMFNLVLCVIACIGGVGALIGIAVAAVMGQKNLAVTAAILGTLGLAGLIGGAIGIVVLLMPHDLRVILCEKGVVRVEGNRFLVFLWEDAVELYQDIADVYAYGLVHTAREYGFMLYRCDGESMDIYEGVNARDVAPLSDMLQAKMAERLLPTVKKQYQAGAEIVFGPLTISKKGVSNGAETIPWRGVEAIKIARGIITISRSGEWLSWSKVHAGEIPNLHVFLTLVDQIIGVNR